MPACAPCQCCVVAHLPSKVRRFDPSRSPWTSQSPYPSRRHATFITLVMHCDASRYSCSFCSIAPPMLCSTIYALYNIVEVSEMLRCAVSRCLASWGSRPGTRPLYVQHLVELPASALGVVPSSPSPFTWPFAGEWVYHRTCLSLFYCQSVLPRSFGALWYGH